MESINTLSDYISLKEKLKNRAAVYEEILETISDDLGFKFFSNLFKVEKQRIVISSEIQKSHYLNMFFGTSQFYNNDERNVFYEMAQFLFAVKENEVWEEKEKLNPTINPNSVEYCDLYYDRMFEYFKEFDTSCNNNDTSEQFKCLRDESFGAGHTIAMAFYMINHNRIEEDYIQYFCKTLDEYICFISHTEFYESEAGAWLEKLFG